MIFGTRTKGIGRKVRLKTGRKRLRQWWEKPAEGTRARVIRELDIEHSRKVRRRDKACVTCRRTDDLQASHFYKRKWLHVRWDDRNVHAMCGDCNQRHNNNVWPYTNFMLDRYGDDVLTELFELRNCKRYIPTPELEEWLDEMRKQR